MNDLQVFKFESKEVRTVMIGGEPWFVAKDVCDVLGLTNTSMVLDRLDDDEKLNKSDLTSLGQRGGWIVNESGLYNIILRSDKPEARKFKKWVTSEVLPSIRKTGSYSIPRTDDEIIAIGYEKAVQKIKQLETQIETDRPKVDFAMDVRYAKNGIIVREFSKILCGTGGAETGEKRLYKWLREQGIVRPESTEPYQKYIDMGVFQLREDTYKDSRGKVMTKYTPLITGKGQVYLADKWKKHHEKNTLFGGKA